MKDLLKSLKSKAMLQIAIFATLFVLMDIFIEMNKKTEEQVTYSITLENLLHAQSETDGENTNGQINQNCSPDRRYCELSGSCIPWEEPCSLDSSTGDNGGDTVGCSVGSRHQEGSFYYDCNTCTRIQNSRGYGDSRRCTLPFPRQ